MDYFDIKKKLMIIMNKIEKNDKLLMITFVTELFMFFK